MKNSTFEKLTSFIRTERERFSSEDNNRFATAFSKLTRYYQFLLIIFGRYKDAGNSFVQNTKELQALARPGTHPTTPDQLHLLNEGWMLASVLHLEIESFYLFAKILLDRGAHAIEFYFGPVRKRPLDSHDDLVKNLAAYAGERKLSVSLQLMDLAKELKRDVSDHRDYEIAHEKSPRTMFATGSDAKGATTIISTKLYPTERDDQTQTLALEQISAKIDEYLSSIIEFVKSNQDKSKLELRQTSE